MSYMVAKATKGTSSCSSFNFQLPKDFFHTRPARTQAGPYFLPSSKGLDIQSGLPAGQEDKV